MSDDLLALTERMTNASAFALLRYERGEAVQAILKARAQTRP